MSPHPLMECRFEQELYGDPNTVAKVTLNLYHVPRAGDLIAFQALQGKVKSVTWLEEYAIVRLIGKVKDE